MTVAQTLDVVHGLVNNMEVVMEGTYRFLEQFTFVAPNTNLVDGKAPSDDIRQALGGS
jgi:hypothetical protein